MKKYKQGFITAKILQNCGLVVFLNRNFHLKYFCQPILRHTFLMLLSNKSHGRNGSISNFTAHRCFCQHLRLLTLLGEHPTQVVWHPGSAGFFFGGWSSRRRTTKTPRNSACIFPWKLTCCWWNKKIRRSPGDPIIYKVQYIQTVVGLGISEPSTVAPETWLAGRWWHVLLGFDLFSLAFAVSGSVVFIPLELGS